MTHFYLTAHKFIFLLAISVYLPYYCIMKVREIKIRKTMIFTKARPHKNLIKYNRKPKHKKNYEH